MSYEQKYLKYKQKYLSLKKLIGAGGCPAANPDDPSELINMDNKKAVLRNYLKAVNRENDGNFGQVKSGVMNAENHPDWNDARDYYEAGCVFGPPCATQRSKEACTDGRNAKLMSDKGFLCRWDMTKNKCEERPKDKISFQ
jgi:hypothetical protein